MSRFALAIVAVVCGCTKREDTPSSPSPPPAPVAVDAASPVADAASPPVHAPPRPADPSSTWTVHPPGGLVVARDRFQPRIAVGATGVIVAHAAPTERAPPPYAARSECEWSESLTVLLWKDLEGAAPAVVASPACSRTRPSFRPELADLTNEPLAIACEQNDGYRCSHVTLDDAPPPIALPASLGAPRLVAYYANLLGPERRPGVLGAQLTGTKLTATATRVGDPPATGVLVDRVDPACDDAADCHLSILPSGDGTFEVTLAHRSGKKLVVRMDEHARPVGAPTTTTEKGDPRPSKPLAIGDRGTLVRRYGKSPALDVPIDGPVGRPVLSFDDAPDPTTSLPAALAVAWIEGPRPDARLRVGRLLVSPSAPWQVSSPVVDVARGDLGSVAIASLAGHLALAWSERQGRTWAVRVAELRAR